MQQLLTARQRGVNVTITKKDGKSVSGKVATFDSYVVRLVIPGTSVGFVIAIDEIGSLIPADT